MALVRAFSLPGIRCWFYSNDHDPPHFHAKKDGEWEVRVFFLEGRDSILQEKWKWNRTAMRNDLRRDLIRLATEYRQELLKEWEKIHAGDP